MPSLAGFGVIGGGCCRIYMVLHGQTVMTTQMRFRGWRDVLLDAVGRREAGPSMFDWQFAMPTGSAVVFDVAGDRISLAQPVDSSEPDPLKSGTAAITPPIFERTG